MSSMVGGNEKARAEAGFFSVPVEDQAPRRIERRLPFRVPPVLVREAVRVDPLRVFVRRVVPVRLPVLAARRRAAALRLAAGSFFRFRVRIFALTDASERFMALATSWAVWFLYNDTNCRISAGLQAFAPGRTARVVVVFFLVALVALRIATNSC